MQPPSASHKTAALFLASSVPNLIAPLRERAHSLRQAAAGPVGDRDPQSELPP
jgi:hypothetical protein